MSKAKPLLRVADRKAILLVPKLSLLGAAFC
jgi:hypothetical protein